MIGRTVVSIGNFDGVHQGHRALVRQGKAIAGAGGRVVVYCFDPHPFVQLRPAHVPARLTTFEERARLLGEAGADEVKVLAPTADFLAQGAEEFVGWIVAEEKPGVILEGPDFHFGRNREGNVETLKELGERHGFAVEVMVPVEAVLTDQTIVTASSTMARWLLAHGRVADVAIVLGKRYRIEGEVRAGVKRGRTLGFPTANVEATTTLPGAGVYAAIARVVGDTSGREYGTAVNVGRRPTFGSGGGGMVCEAHLTDFAGPVGEYGWRLGLEFVAFLRGEMRFADGQALAAQVERDVARVADYVSIATARRSA